LKKIILLFITILYLNATIYYGEGSGNSYAEAKRKALEDVASQISVVIDSKIEETQSVKNDKYHKNFKVHSIQKTKVNLEDYEIVEKRKENNQFFVKIKYDNIPSLDKFASKTPYTKEQIKNGIKKDFGKSLGLELVRKNRKWYIKYKNILQKLDKKDFYLFFKTTNRKDLKISLYNKRRNILHNGDEFSFLIKSAKSGYITIFDVYEDGTVSILAKNLKIDKKRKLIFPDEDSDSVLEASLLQNQKETFDMYVVLFTKKKRNFDEFISAYDDVVDEELYKNFDELINLIYNKTYATIKVIIRPR
jgi:hypothetical protein